jgi:TetR/AcrR family transcriptional regulator
MVSKSDSGDGRPTPANAQAPRRTARWEQRRRQILQTAEVVFADLGFGAATLEEVAARLDLRRASLAYYFEDKEALFDGVFHEILLDLSDRLEPAFDADDPIEGIESFVSLWVGFLQERPAAGRVLLRQMVDGLSPRSSATRGSFFDLIARLSALIERGVEERLFKALDAGQYGAMIAGTSLLWVSSRDSLRRGLGFDPLAPEQMESLRHRLVQLTRQLLEATAPRT